MKKVRPLLGLLVVVAAGLLYVSHGNVSRLMSLPNLMTRQPRPGAATVPSRAPMPVTGRPGAPSAGAPGSTQAAARPGSPAASPGAARGTPGATPSAPSAPAKGSPTPAGAMPAAPTTGTPGKPPAQGASPTGPSAGAGSPATPGKPAAGAAPAGGEPQPGSPTPSAQPAPNPNSEAVIVGSGPRGRQDPFIPLATPGFGGGGVPSLPLPPLPGQLPGQLPGFTTPGMGAGGGGRMRVAGIMGSRSRVAIIESEGRTYIVGEGERVGGAVVVSIQPEKVVLKENNVTFELNIGGEQSS